MSQIVGDVGTDI
jgi:hypothetical protein